MADCNNFTEPGFPPPVNLSLPWLFDFADWFRWLASVVPDAATPADASSAGDEDAACFLRAAGGDERGLQRLFDKWKHPLLGFFYRSLGSHADAEDLTLEVFVRLHRAAPGYRPTAKFSTCLFHIARNLLRNEQRRRRRKPAQPAPPEVFDTVRSESDADGRRLAELEEVLRRAMVRVPEKYRTPLLLLQQQMDCPASEKPTLREIAAGSNRKPCELLEFIRAPSRP